jgi:hypothetical protein
MLDKPLTLDDFTPHLFSKFQVCLQEPAENTLLLEVELIEITELKYQRKGDLGSSFSLIFRGDANLILPQQIYQFEHEVMGSFEMFIVPIGPDEQGMCYEAIFN